MLNEPTVIKLEKPAFPERSIDQAFVMSMCVIFSIPILFGYAPKPGAIEFVLPTWMGYCWAFTLLIGSAIILFSYVVRDRVTAVVIEQFGSIVLGITAFIYGVTVWFVNWDSGGRIAGAIILGFAAARFLQAWRYQKFLNKVRTVLNQVEEEADERRP